MDLNTGLVYAGRTGEVGRWKGPETGEEGVVAEVYLTPVAVEGWARRSARESGERGRPGVGRTPAREGSWGRGFSWLVGERGGGVERLAKGSVSKRSLKVESNETTLSVVAKE